MRNLFKILIVFAVLSADTLLAGTSKPPQDVPEIKHCVSPIGNMWEVYSFIADYILAENKRKRDLPGLVKRELEIEELQNGKPIYADIVEGEMSHIVRDLCQAHPWCYEIKLFTKQGVIIAFTGRKKDLVFKEDKDDIYEWLGFLHPDPIKHVGTKKLTCISDNATYFRITKAIYFNKENGGMYFLRKNDPQDEIVGYISYIVHPVYFEEDNDVYGKFMAAKYGLK
ncbi:hypothetical protein FACS189472_05230 [Alphaproteobacteria bacterium]|nr:hypothetical protein FACS189472_05230 [Alphaproteobacteria bacterium]